MNTSVVLSLFGGDRKRLIRFTDADTAGFDEATPVGADDIRQLVQLAVGVRELSAGVDDRLPSWLERTAILLIGDAVAGQLRADIVDALEFSTPAAEQMARKRARERSAEPHLRRVLADVFAVLPPETRAA